MGDVNRERLLKESPELETAWTLLRSRYETLVDADYRIPWSFSLGVDAAASNQARVEGVSTFWVSGCSTFWRLLGMASTEQELEFTVGCEGDFGKLVPTNLSPELAPAFAEATAAWRALYDGAKSWVEAVRAHGEKPIALSDWLESKRNGAKS